MDDNLAWKVVIFGAAFSLFILAVAYYIISPKGSEYFTEERTQKIAEFKDMRVAGRKEGKKAWLLQAKYGWTDPDRDTSHLYDVTSGEVYKDEKLVISELHAPFAKTFRRSEIIETFAYSDPAKNNGKKHIKCYINLGRIADPRNPKQDEFSRLSADYLKYSPKEKKTEIKGNVELHKKDSSIYAQTININNETNIAEIRERIKLIRRDGVLLANSLTYFSKEEKLRAEQEVVIKIREKNVKTNIKADTASFSTDMKEDMSLAGALELKQGKKTAVARTGIYSQKNKSLLLEDKVRAVFEKGGVLLKETSAEKLRNPEARELLAEKTFVSSKSILFSTLTGDATASGSVEVTQQKKAARAEQAVYDDKKELITLTGHAFMKKASSAEAEWVQAKKIVVSVKDETFEAEGEVEAKIKI